MLNWCVRACVRVKGGYFRELDICVDVCVDVRYRITSMTHDKYTRWFNILQKTQHIGAAWCCAHSLLILIRYSHNLAAGSAAAKRSLDL